MSLNMPLRLQNLLIKLLFRFIDIPIKKPTRDLKADERKNQWLADSFAHPGFQAYFDERHYSLVNELAGGIGLSEMDRDKYIRITGQRFEIFRLYTSMRSLYLAQSRKLRQQREANEEKKNIQN